MSQEKTFDLGKIEEISKVIYGAKRIISHDKCMDGLVSAVFLKQMAPTAEVIFTQRKTPEMFNLPAGGNVFIDIEPPSARVEELVAAGDVVIDHHTTAKEIVERFGDRGYFTDDRYRSSAMQAYILWAFGANGGPPCGEDERQSAYIVAQLVSVRDTWDKGSHLNQEAQEFNAVAKVLPRSVWFELPFWHELSAVRDVARLGPAFLEEGKRRVAQDAKRVAIHTCKNGVRVGFLGGGGSISDLADFLTAELDVLVGVTWNVHDFDGVKTRQTIYSMRSRTHNVEALARTCGGGGHPGAAGFTVTSQHWGNDFEYLFARVEEHGLQPIHPREPKESERAVP